MTQGVQISAGEISLAASLMSRLRPRAYSNANLCGMIDGDASVLKTVRDGERVRGKRYNE